MFEFWYFDPPDHSTPGILTHAEVKFTLELMPLQPGEFLIYVSG